MNQVKPYSRGPQVLRLLYEQGPLSIKTMQKLLRPEIKRRSLQEVVTRLYKNGLVLKRFNSFVGQKQFFVLPQADNSRNEIAEILSVEPESLLQPYVRTSELYHTEQCAMWAEYLKEMFPEAQVIRDFHVVKDEFFNECVLKNSDPETMVIPDILLVFKNEDGSRSVYVGIEIELTQKSNQRLVKKIDRYSNYTHLDGVIYICSRNTLLEVVRHRYENQVRREARIRSRYGKHFMLYGLNSFDDKSLEPKLFNVDNEHVSLKHWVHILRTKFMYDRCDEAFQPPTTPGGRTSV